MALQRSVPANATPRTPTTRWPLNTSSSCCASRTLNSLSTPTSNQAAATLSHAAQLAMLSPAATAAAAADTLAAGARLSVIARGFVGQATPLAAEYHSHDYDWQQHAQQTEPLVDQQWAGAPADVRDAAVLDAAGRPLSAVAELLLKLGATTTNGFSSNVNSSGNGVGNTTHLEQPAAGATAANTGAANTTTRSSSPTTTTTSSTSNSSSQEAPENEWEQFYRAHPAAKFFKERRYLLLEFPCLAPPSQLQHVVEIGAGCGSSILPVLRAQPAARATLTDISSTCLQQLLQAMQHLGLDTDRVATFTADGTSDELQTRLTGCDADAVLIMFTLSAVVPEGMLGMMRNAAAALRPGGLLCIRDHALYDMVRLDVWVMLGSFVASASLASHICCCSVTAYADLPLCVS